MAREVERLTSNVNSRGLGTFAEPENFKEDKGFKDFNDLNYPLLS